MTMAHRHIGRLSGVAPGESLDWFVALALWVHSNAPALIRLKGGDPGEERCYSRGRCGIHHCRNSRGYDACLRQPEPADERWQRCGAEWPMHRSCSGPSGGLQEPLIGRSTEMTPAIAG